MVIDVSATLVASTTLRRSLRGKHLVLLFGRQIAVQRHHGQVPCRGQRFQPPGRLADFAHAGQEHQHVASGLVKDPPRGLGRAIGNAAAFQILNVATPRPDAAGPGFPRTGQFAQVTGDRLGCRAWPTSRPFSAPAAPSAARGGPCQGQVAVEIPLVELVEDDRRHGFRNGSSWSIRSRIPSVTISIRVRGADRRSNRTW